MPLVRWENTEAADALAVGQRYAEVTGDLSIHPTAQVHTQAEAARAGDGGFGIMGHGDQAVVLVGRRHGTAKPDRRMAIIGQHDSTRGKWLFPDEYVVRSEQPALADFLETKIAPDFARMVERARWLADTVVDVRHPDTRKIRRAATDIIDLLNLDELVTAADAIAPPGSPAYVHDDYTICIPVLRPRYTTFGGEPLSVEPGKGAPSTQHTKKAGEVLALCFSGAKRIVDERHTVRGRRSIPLAERDDGLWVPGANIVAPLGLDAWSAVSSLANFMQRTAQRRDFSPELCSIVHNLR